MTNPDLPTQPPSIAEAIDPATSTPQPHPHSTRRWMELLAMAIMALGFMMMFQPFAKIVFTYSFIVILFGTLAFIVAVHLPE